NKGPKYVKDMTDKMIAKNITFFYISKETNLCNNRIVADNMTNHTGGSFYSYTEAQGVSNILMDISQNIINITYSTQIISTGSDFSNITTILYPDSYIYFNYTPIAEEIKYKEVTVVLDKERFGGSIESPKNKTYAIPNNLVVLDAKVTSYSTDYWTDYLQINNSDGSGWQKIYDLGDYMSQYLVLGDPYILNIPSNKIIPGNNFSISLNTGLAADDKKGASPDNRMIYTFKVPGFVGYGKVFSNKTAAKEDAIERLKLILEVYGITLDDIETEEYFVGKTPWMYGPAIFSIQMWN
ncbi:MAG: hypothetical protein KAQ92_01975, partial [Candidatus Aenigmarchaeota archaeon]|nr:hypothetical protein [Candidatus Aenigmarchaeota archaeon]